MIENQLRPNKITNSNILQAFMNTSKEQFISEDKLNICYSDQDIFIKDRRGYLKNLHLAQILHFADIKNDEKVLHIGGLTGYLSVLISKLCNKIYVTDNDQSFVDSIIKNFSNNETDRLFFKEDVNYFIDQGYKLIIQETRGWDDLKSESIPQRSKEDKISLLVSIKFQ